jgi:hypothetical protein
VKNCGIALETLADYQEGRADASSAEQIRVHLDQNCAHCLQNLVWLQHARETLREAHTIQVPETALKRAHSIFREQFRPVVASNPVLSWLAALQFDSRRNSPTLAGARGAKHDGIQLVYTTNVHDIELFQEPAGQGNWYMIGQVMPREGTATIIPNEIVLTERNGSRLTFRPDTEEFHLPAIPRGLYEIALRLNEGEITMPDVGVGL